MNKNDYRHDVAAYVQNYMPIYPKSGANLQFPLRYLVCDDTDELDVKLSTEEKEMNEAIKDFKEYPDLDISKNIKNELDNVTRNQNKKITAKVRIIKGNSGSGKSIFLGKIISRLIGMNEGDGIDDKHLIIYSQLKDVSSHKKALWDSILEGMHDPAWRNQKESIEQFCKRRNITDTNRGVIFIDSLDEISRGDGKLVDQFLETSKRLLENGLQPIWTCREHDYNNEGLGGHRTHATFKQAFKEIDVPKLKGVEIDQTLSKKISEEQNKWLKHCYENNPLLLTLETNFRLPKDIRNKFAKKLNEYLIENVKKSEARFEQDTEPINSLGESIELEKLSKYSYMILYDILSQFMIDSITEVRKENTKVKELINKFGLYNYHIVENRPEKLKEKLSPELCKEYWQECADLEQFGMLKKIRDGEYRVSHRSFAEFAVIQYVKQDKDSSGLEKKISGQLLFNWRFPWNDSILLEEFCKRTGSFINIIEPMKSQVEKTDWRVLKRGGEPWKSAFKTWPEFQTPRGDFEERVKKLSTEQFDTVLAQKSKPLLLSGFPGTGKTFTGVEMMIGHLNNLLDKNIDKKGLIVTLNSQLADAIEIEIPEMHKDTERLEGTERGIEEIMKKMEIGSVKKIISTWAPDFIKDCKKKDTRGEPDWLIEIPLLRKTFDKMDITGISRTEKNNYWRLCLDDYQNCIFQIHTGELKDETKYLKESLTAKRDKNGEKIAQKWYRLIGQLSKERFPLHLACIILRNRFIHVEIKMQNDLELEKLFEDFPVRSPFQSEEENDKQIVNDLKNKISEKGFYEAILVDEIQDLPSQFAILSSFMCPDRNENEMGHKLMFVGDENQALNQDRFEWDEFSKEIGEIANIIINSESLKAQKLMYKNFHLSQLIEGKGNPVTQLKENQRNVASIGKIMLQGNNWLGGESNELSMEFMKEDPDPSLIPAKIITTKSWDEWEQIISNIMVVLNSESSISLVITDRAVHDYIIRRMEDDDIDKKIKESEVFDTWTIKGLERPSVVVIGGWIVSQKGQFFSVYDKIKGKNEPEKWIEESDLELMRSRMLVALSRATQKMLVLTAPAGISDSSGLNSQENQLLQLKAPTFDDEFMTGTKDIESIRSILKPHHYSKQNSSLIALTEGIKLLQRSTNDPSLAEQIPRFHSRWEIIIGNDGNESNIRELFEKIDDYESTLSLSENNEEIELDIISENPLLKLILNMDNLDSLIGALEELSDNGYMNQILSNSCQINHDMNWIINLPIVWNISELISKIIGRMEHFEWDENNNYEMNYFDIVKKATLRVIDDIETKYRITRENDDNEGLSELDFYNEQISKSEYGKWDTLLLKDNNKAIEKCLSILANNEVWEYGEIMDSNLMKLMEKIRHGKDEKIVKDFSVLSRFLNSISKSTDDKILLQAFLLYSIIPKPDIPSNLLSHFLAECGDEDENERVAFESIINSPHGIRLIKDVFNSEVTEIVANLAKLPVQYKIILVKRMIQIKDEENIQQHNAWEILTPLINKYLNTWLKEITNEKLRWKITTHLGGISIPETLEVSGSQIRIKINQDRNEELLNDVIQVALQEGVKNITKNDSLTRSKNIPGHITIDDKSWKAVSKIETKLAITMLEVVSILKGFEMIYKEQNDVQRFFEEKERLPILVKTMINLVKKDENQDWVSNTLDTNLEMIKKLIEKDWARREKGNRAETKEKWDSRIKDEIKKCGTIMKELIHRWAAHLWILEIATGHENHRTELNKICKLYPSLPKAKLSNGKFEFIPDNNINDIKISVLQDALLDLTMENRPVFKPMILSNQGFWESGEKKFSPFNITKKEWFLTKHRWDVNWGDHLLEISLAKRPEDVRPIIINISKIATNLVIKRMEAQKGKSMNLKTLMRKILDFYKKDILDQVARINDWRDIKKRKWPGWDTLPEVRIKVTPSWGVKMSRPTTKDGSVKGFIIDILVMSGIVIEKNDSIVWDNNEIEKIKKGFEDISKIMK
ncbi:MAG: AAA family ATPase [Euryarchaeota archaeon]|nr:AAA family ATPase [Euryarchaeota archaeon]